MSEVAWPLSVFVIIIVVVITAGVTLVAAVIRMPLLAASFRKVHIAAFVGQDF
jgi:hypothetical protein